MQSTLRHSSHFFDLLSEIRGSVCVQGELYCNQKACNRYRERGAEQYVIQTSGTNKEDKSDNKESKNEGSAARSTNFVEAPDSKTRAASIPKDQLIVSSFILFGVNICTDTTVTNYKIFLIPFFVVKNVAVVIQSGYSLRYPAIMKLTNCVTDWKLIDILNDADVRKASRNSL